MNLPEDIQLYFAPDDVMVDARIVTLTRGLFNGGMGEHWWDEPALDSLRKLNSIDRDWSWFDAVDLHGHALRCVRVAAVTGDGQVQGAMVVSIDCVESVLNPNQRCLHVDQLCTAPRNRPALRTDGGHWYKGVGTQMLQWAARLSLEAGGEGKLHLLASPEGQPAYKRLGFENLNLAPQRYDDVEYEPMELPLAAVRGFLQR